MKLSLFLPFFFLTGLNSFGQKSNCDSLKFSQSDKKLLGTFWAELKYAIDTKNKVKLASLINFPFPCDYCTIDSSKDTYCDNIKVTRKTFDQKQYKIFFDYKLERLIDRTHNLVDIIGRHFRNKNCYLHFGYNSVEPSKSWEGQQHF